MTNSEPFTGRDAYLHELSSSDLSVEELLASGADVSSLVSAGVLRDDYPEGHEFTEEVPEEETYDGPPMSDEEFEALMAGLDRCAELRHMGRGGTSTYDYRFR
jgi:hypothetical protein